MRIPIPDGHPLNPGDDPWSKLEKPANPTAYEQTPTDLIAKPRQLIALRRSPSLSIQRGTNISHWLSQSEERGIARRSYFTRGDMQRIADWGLDHIRLPIDEQQMWNVSGGQESEAFDLLDEALDWAHQAGLKAVVDLHILRSHFFISAEEPALFTDPAEPERFAGLWRQLSARLRKRPHNEVAYELLNEAVAADHDDWNRVARVAFQAIRELEPRRTIVLGSNRWNSALTFDKLIVPDDENTILTFHFYLPMLITHHRAQWCPEGRMYGGPIQYPGQPIPDEYLPQVNLPALERLVKLDLAEANKPYNRNCMAADIRKAVEVMQQTGLPLYCGEFGPISLAPLPIRKAWLRDLISLFEEFGIGWANWDYKSNDFGMVNTRGEETGIAEAMFSKPPPSI